MVLNVGNFFSQNYSLFIIGGFFSSLFSGLFGTREMRILILGLDGAGKTTILYRLQVGEVVTTIPSMCLTDLYTQLLTCLDVLGTNLPFFQLSNWI